MAVEFTFEDKEANLFFKNIQKRLENIENGQTTFVSILGAVVFKDVMDHFKNEEGSEGPWAKWSPNYTAHMRDIGRGGNKKLQFTGFLRQSFQPYKVRKVSNGLEWFNTAKYSQAHDEGIGQTKRDFMWLSPEAAEKLAAQTLRYIKSEVG